MSQSMVARSLTGDLDDIVNSVARRAGRRKPRKEKVPSPTRNRPYSPANGSSQLRVPRGMRVRSGSPRNSPVRIGRSKTLDSATSAGSNSNASDIGSSNISRAASSNNGFSRTNTSEVEVPLLPAAPRPPGFRRMSTVDSRNRFIKMLESKTLTSFRHLNQRVVENNKPRTYMSRLFVTFEDCLDKLDAQNINAPKLESMAILIHECMSGDSRNYHSVQHVFEISKDFHDNDPIAVLAAMFHDCIYYNVDGGLSIDQKNILHGCFQPDGYTCRAHGADHHDAPLAMVENIFGYHLGEEITGQKGLNEFLSAVVAVRQLEDHLTKAQCAKIACCIAATIPFKNKPTEGKKTHMEELYDHMVETNDNFSLGMATEELVRAVQRAAKVANADIGNFGSDDIYYFLDNTWSLLTETNTTLRRSFLFTVMEFQHSLFKMNGFFHFLDPAAIFATFQNDPPSEEITKLTEQARKNLELGQKYVGAKLLSASVLAAFAALTGGDAPLSLFVGDLPSRHHNSQSINDALPGAKDNPFFNGVGADEDDVDDHLDMLVYQILSGGRRSESSFDVKQSPLGAFLYAVVGDRGLRMILDNKDLHPMTRENAIALLACIPREVTLYLAKTIACVAVSRTEAIMEVVDSLPTKTFGRASMVPQAVTIEEHEELKIVDSD
eukprot:Sro67_g037450.2  (665) ;mRNA; f:18692-20686